MEKLISVIVPIYKVEDYLHRCVDSILNQSYSNIEVILVDDGSPDRCGDICEEYKLRDNRIIVIHKKNGGLSDARNAGTDVAKGELITYIDSDDWVHRDFLRILSDQMTKTNADIAVCSNISTPHFLEDKAVDDTEYTVYEKKDIEKLLWANVDQRNKLHRDMIVAWGKLYKKEIIGSIRYPFGKIHEDNFVTYQLLFASSRVVYTSAQLVYYFQRDDSITAGGFNVRKRMDMVESYDQRARFFRDKGYAEIADFCHKFQFLKAFNIDHYLDASADTARAEEFRSNRKKLKHQLRQGKFGPGFRLFFELYYLSPKLFLAVHDKLRGKSSSAQ